MLRKLTRIQAWLLLAALTAACVWAAALAVGHANGWTSSETPPYSDQQLYRDIATAVAGGEDYYAAATALHRQHGFPTVPFVTVRLPTLVLAAAAVGWNALHAVLVALLAASAIVWYAALRGAVSKAERLGVVLFAALGGAVVSVPVAVPHHDQWAGLLITLALPLRGGRAWPAAVACAAAAVAIRELAIAFVLLALAFAMFERRWREAAAWAMLTAVFVAAMAWHAHMVAAYVLPGDIHSPGWTGMRGPAGTLGDVIAVSVLQLLPPLVGVPLVIVALIGWLGAPARVASFTLLWLLGFGTAIALFGRDNTTYWAVELMPAWLMGLAFVPRAAGDLRAALAKEAAAR